MKNTAIVVGTLAVAVVVALWVVNVHVAKAPSPLACTQEAKLCPDGSAVGRAGPNCEFAECPAANATSTTSGGRGNILPYNSGVRGVVSLGPTCPVERIPPDPQCADKGYATTIIVHRDRTGAAFARATSDASGAFQISLPPSSYTLTAGSGTMLPRCNPVDVTVGASGYVTADISCDTGIR